jgi:fluoroquinolone transport system ATP-binding protein
MIEHGKRRVTVEYQLDGKLLEKEFEMHNLAGNGEFLDILETNDIKTIHSCEATLEDIFIKLTGRNLQ